MLTDRQLLERVDWRLAVLLRKEESVMANLADLAAEVAAEKTVDDSVVALLNGLTANLAAAVAANDPAAVQAVLDSMKVNSAELAAAVAANTPAAPPPTT